MNRVLSGLVLAVLAGACGKAAPPPPAPAAKVSNPVKEPELSRVTLTPEAEQRLGIVIGAVESRVVPETRTLGGVIVTPPGRSFSLTAPVAATVLAPGAGVPRPGTPVTRGQPLLRLVPLPPDRELMRGDEDVAIAEVRARQAEQDAARVEALARDSLVSRRELERAVADRDAARTALAAARTRLERQRTGMTSPGTGLTPLTIASPDNATVVELFTNPGQVVAAGAPLMVVARLDPLWVKVAVFAGDLARIAPGGEASVDALQEGGGSVARRARRVLGPPTADPLSASGDVFYELSSGAGLRPGQRVDVTLELRGAPRSRTVVPLGAIVYDQGGGAWVYVKEAEHVYARRRVSLDGIVGQWALLARGPEPGTPVVLTGAAELFGTEFGAGK